MVYVMYGEGTLIDQMYQKWLMKFRTDRSIAEV